MDGGFCHYCRRAKCICKKPKSNEAGSLSGSAPTKLSELAEQCADEIRDEANPDFFGVTILKYLELAQAPSLEKTQGLVSNGYPLNKLAEEIEHTVFFREVDIVEYDVTALKIKIANFVRSKVFAGRQ